MLTYRCIDGIHMVRAFAITDGMVVRKNGIDLVAMRHNNGVLVLRPDLRGAGSRSYIMPASQEWVEITGERRGTKHTTRKQPATGGYRALEI